MAKEMNQDSKTETTRTRSRKSTRMADTDLDLTTAVASAVDEGFSNHPHPEVIEKTVENVAAAQQSASEIVSQIRGYATDMASKAQDTVRERTADLRAKIKEIPETGREAMAKVDSSARENPWIAIGLASVGALALGFLTARLFTSAIDSE